MEGRGACLIFSPGHRECLFNTEYVKVKDATTARYSTLFILKLREIQFIDEMNADDTKYICLPAVDIKTEYEPKEEILDETLVSYGLSYPGSDPTSGHETKCGSIFLSVERTYIFVCEYCCARFGDMGSLGVHLEDVHFDYIKQEDFRLETVPKEEADPDCDTIEDEGNYFLLKFKFTYNSIQCPNSIPGRASTIDRHHHN